MSEQERRTLDLPDRRKTTYAELEKKLAEELKGITDWLRSLIKKIIVGFVVLGLACALALVGYGYLLRQQHKVTDRIQAQRVEFVRNGCLQQNARHKRVLGVLTTIINKAEKKHPNLKKAYEDSRAQNLLLINALAPFADCQALVRAALAEPGKKGGQ